MVTGLALPAHGISIHTASEGGDPMVKEIAQIIVTFQSTPPAKAVTGDPYTNFVPFTISIHTASEGGDKIDKNADLDVW